MFAWHWNFIDTTRVLPNRLQELKLSNSCCPDCSTKSKCKTIRCHCRKDHKLCSHCISKKCENKGDAKEEEGGGAELDDDEEAEEEEEEEKKGDQDVNSLSTMMNILHP
jgi:hypothetical protein